MTSRRHLEAWRIRTCRQIKFFFKVSKNLCQEKTFLFSYLYSGIKTKPKNHGLRNYYYINNLVWLEMRRFCFLLPGMPGSNLDMRTRYIRFCLHVRINQTLYRFRFVFIVSSSQCSVMDLKYFFLLEVGWWLYYINSRKNHPLSLKIMLAQSFISFYLSYITISFTGYYSLTNLYLAL